MANTVQLKDEQGTIIYPVTKTTAVFDESGNSIEGKYINSVSAAGYTKVTNDTHAGAQGLVFHTASDNIPRGSIVSWYGDGYNQFGIRCGNANYIGELKVTRAVNGSEDPYIQLHKYDNGTWTYLGNIPAAQRGGGFWRLSDDTQICWGWFSSVTSSGVTVTYPVPFKTVDTVIATSTATNLWAYIRCEYNGTNGSNFVLRTNSTCPANWLAIGTWK